LQAGVVPEQFALLMHGTHTPAAVSHAGVAPTHWLAFVAEHWPHAPDAWHAGVAPPQSVSAWHASQRCVPVLQAGVVPEQVALLVHCTHTPAAVSHAGVAPVHWPAFVAEHWPHAPDPWHAGVKPLQSPSLLHAWQRCVPMLHAGVAPEQLALLVHCTHTPAAVLHAGVAPPHWVAFVAEHWPHVPDGWHAGVAPLQSPSTPHAPQRCEAVLHTGFAPEQLALLMHWTHTPATVLQAGVPPVHWVVLAAEHWPHAPDPWHAGVAAPQSPSPLHAWHRCVPTLHTGFVPEQLALLVHATHAPAAVSHAGVGLMHRVELVAEHWPHAPDPWHAGVATPHSPSPAHPRHRCVAALHTGVVPEQLALLEHWTHTAAAVSQAGVAPVHLLVFVAEHWPHAPENWHAGVAPLHSPSQPHARHVCVPVSHTGFVPEQLALVMHSTHSPTAALHAGVAPMHWVAFVAEHW
jgi:hypothetical protein